MIFYKYLFKEIAKTQIIILLILLTVFLCQSLIKLISRAAVGALPVEVISSLALYAIPEIAMIMLPLTLFLSILLTLGRICSDSEMVVLRSVGFSPVNVMAVTMLLALITAVVTGYTSIYLMPESIKTRDALTSDAKNNPRYLPIESGRFVNLGERFTVYIDEVEGSGEDKTISRIYVMDTPFELDRGSITIAERGYLQNDAQGVRWLYLFDGKRYEGTLNEGAFRRINFSKFQAPAARDNTQAAEDTSKNAMPTSELLDSDNISYQVEAQWRISPIFAVFVLSFIAVPLSMVNPRQGRFAKLMPALLIYAAYYMFLLSVRNLINHGNLPLYPGLYLVPLLFTLLAALPLNLPRRFVMRLLPVPVRSGQVAGTTGNPKAAATADEDLQQDEASKGPVDQAKDGKK